MELKRLAQNARNRLIHKGESGTKRLSSLARTNIKFKVISSKEDDTFEAKARQMLSDGALNPIGELMDSGLYNSLTSSQKERYLFATLERYGRVKEKFDCGEEQKLVY